jgi:hypothetical protein
LRRPRRADIACFTAAWAYPSSPRRDDLSSRQVVPNASIELGTNLTLTFLRDKRAEANRIQQREPIHLGLPAVGFWNGS